MPDMASPAEEINQPQYQNYQNYQNSSNRFGERSSDEDGTIVGEGSVRVDDPNESRQNLTVNTSKPPTADDFADMKSPSKSREQAHRLDDDLRMLQVERQVSAEMSKEENEGPDDAKSIKRERSRRAEVVDEFDVATNPIHQKAQVYKPPENPEGNFAKLFKKIHNSNVLIRYFTYIVPLVLIILIPLLIGALWPAVRSQDPNVGGVRLVWFCVWLEVIWLTLWAGRVLAKALPYPAGLIASLFTNNSKKWRDLFKQLELAVTLFFWMLGVEISFLPIMRNHQVDYADNVAGWTEPMNKVLISLLVMSALNLVEKVIIQLIAISFHLRTYQDRIEVNKFQIGSLTKLYQFSRIKIAMEDSDFEAPSGEPGSGARTPAMIEKAHKNTKEAFNKFGDVAGKIAGDFTGKAITQSGHPSQVVLNLLSTTPGSQVLARRLYRTFGREETQTVFQDDLKDAFENNDEADAAFSMFDKDLNGDISMEELEAVCVEIGRERKSITASLKDLDSVVSKLDQTFMFIVFVITVLVFVSLLATASSGVLTSAGSAVLGLSWLFATTAQEFLQSVIFVFVKHPFDVGDRVTIYGTTGSQLKGDDYFVKEIALLYTEFKKMEGQVVQAPNSYLNTLFILNIRRSGGLAEAVPMVFKFGTTLEQIQGLRDKLLEFVKIEKREYQSNILTELREISEAHSITLNVIFFFKSNWQNELLRLQRRNKFICAMMVAMQELQIEGPRMRFPGQTEHYPVYTQSMPYSSDNAGYGATPDYPSGRPRDTDNISVHDAYYAHETDGSASRPPPTRPRGESIAAARKRVDFSLGMSSVAPGDLVGDVHDSRQNKPRIPINVTSHSPSRSSREHTSRDRASHETRHSRRERSVSDARTTGRSSNLGPGNLTHRGTEPARPAHRNRFFGRKSGESDQMETGMAGIPEVSRENTTRLDARSGTISPVAVRATEEGHGTNQSSHTMFNTADTTTIAGQQSRLDLDSGELIGGQDFHTSRQ
ncbi:MAG: hypothetical protein M1831_000690 [Alyxoria varia]|nr:MAG: hypothetical protein M1831_000690 [Alyxoria varia]